MSAFLFTLCFVSFLIIVTTTKAWLLARQVRTIAVHRSQVPASFSATVSPASHQKAADYTIAKSRLAVFELVLAAMALIAWTLLGGLNFLNQSLLALLEPGLVQQIALLAAFVMIAGLLDAPLSLYQTFVLEEKFGFNKMTFRLWLVDSAKSLMVGWLIGLPLAAAVLWFMAQTGVYWWLWTWVFWTGFSILLMLVYPTLIAPMFNQFKPLGDAPLTERVSALMQRCGFTAKGFFVMDGSRRSAHANAYFTGFGASKRVVFYDILLARLSGDEVEAVLAHELGHFHHKHLLRRLLIMVVFSLCGFAAMGYCSTQLWFFTGLGVAPHLTGPNDAVVLLLFLMVAPLITFWVSPLASAASRRHEFQADAYAAKQVKAGHLVSALLKLYEDNAATLTPDPAYVWFYYSHPPALQRLKQLANAHPESEYKF